MTSSESGPAEVVGPSAGERLLVGPLLVGLGGAAGGLLPPLAGWLLGLPWVPLAGPLRLIDALPRTPAVVGGVVAGALVGLTLLGAVHASQLLVTVSRCELRIRHGEVDVTLHRSDIGAVFLEPGRSFLADGRLVVLDRRGAELCSRVGDISATRLADALRAHGYPWRPDGDPYRTAYRLWVPDLPDLPAAAHALLTARHRAVERGDRAEAELLRAELGRLDVVVRDDDVPQVGRRQSWRRVTG
ncbi:hypothetical protein O7632_07885 [Solwaraspora sp. WMMD406]|uniref:YqeB family protein n=1 Tax=Solwaraspora sp. WMMD406 TaxID=3016095 RepID=UPI0024164E84|nr:hypothetical protein [Solwaraspora sp. WMMD406]MDG4764024.1 hypothetical protein [Solwaraspora sp. WMMD406]